MNKIKNRIKFLNFKNGVSAYFRNSALNKNALY